MKAITSLKTNTGCPWAGGVEIDLRLEDIAAIGKLSIYGSFVISYVVRTKFNELLFLNISKMKAGIMGTPEEAKLISKTVKNVIAPSPSRELGWSIRWTETAFEPSQDSSASLA